LQAFGPLHQGNAIYMPNCLRLILSGFNSTVASIHPAADRSI
jgi:hypothetical protein